MMTIEPLKRMLTIVGTLALASLGTGCTGGVLVDDNFKNISSNGSITFFLLDDNMVPTGVTYDFNFNNQPYLSFDNYAPDGATVGSLPGLINSRQYLQPGNYYAEYFQAQTGFAKSNNFVHSFDGTCTDLITGKADKQCEQYYLQVSYSPTCHGCGGPSCAPPQPLNTYNGVKVIQMCAHQF
jgi:hypothetical protein